MGRSAAYRRMFNLPVTEKFIEDFSCALYRNVLRAGRCYVFTNYVCFYTNAWSVYNYPRTHLLPRGELFETIPFEDVIDIQKRSL